MSAGQGDAHPDRNSAWLAAYTLGLVSSVNDADRRLADLLEASDGHHDLLASASRHLQFVEVADPAIRTQALTLLGQALDHAPPTNVRRPDQVGTWAREPSRRPDGDATTN